MKLSAFFLFAAGIISELLLLYDSAKPAQNQRHNRFLPIPFDMAPTLVGLILLVAAGLVAVVELIGVGKTLVYIDSPLIMILFIVLGTAVFFAAMTTSLLLPPVNEQSILLVQCLLLAGNLWGKQRIDWLPVWLTIILPAVLIIVLVARRTPFPFWAKGILFAWHLFSLMITPFQSGETAYFLKNEFTYVEAFSFGFLFIFLIVHGLFAVRFLLVAPSSIIPRNRPLIQQAMSRIFSDEQVSILRFLIVAGLVAALLVVNELVGALDRSAALSLAMLLSVHILRTPAKGMITSSI